MAPLTKLQGNELFRAFDSGNVPIMDFALLQEREAVCFGGRSTELVSVIVHLPTESAFAARRNFGSFTVIARLAAKTEMQAEAWEGFDLSPFSLSSFESHTGPWSLDFDFGSRVDSANPKLAWPGVLTVAPLWALLAGRWLKRSEEYEKIPDLWGELDQSKGLLDASGDNSPFTASEQAEISVQIKQVKEYIKTTYELTGDQIAEVEERLDHAERASGHMGRKDWLTMFYGALFALILPAILPPPAVEHILVMTLHGLGHLFGIGNGPPPHLGHR